MPACITRQTFVLATESGDGLTPTVSYDPVSRIVTVTPSAPLTVGQTYNLTVLPLQAGVVYEQPVDTVIGVMAIDGATLDPAQPTTVTFQATSPVTPVTPAAPVYCPGSEVQKIFAGSCGGASCHQPPPGSMPAQGLVLTDAAGVLATAIGQVAIGGNTGPRPAAQAPNVIFGLDMFIIDPGPGGGAVTSTPGPGGDPGDSWLMYKLLMAVPSPGDAGSIVPLSATERATLASLVPGREMPYPGNPSASLETPGAQLTIDQLELVSSWIAGGAQTGTACP
jgi:hypothetical protein